MMLLDRYDAVALSVTLHLLIFLLMTCDSATLTKDTKQIRSAAACYGNVNNYLRLHCPDDEVINVLKVKQGAKMLIDNCRSPADKTTYNRSCCHPIDTDCKIEAHDTVSAICNGNTQCDVMASWSMITGQCDQDTYPIASTYMQTEYTCVPSMFTEPSTPKPIPTTANMTSITTDGSATTTTTTNGIVVVSTHDQDTGGSDIELNDAIIGAILAGSIGMLLTFVVFIVYWRRKRKLRIIGKPQASVWDYLLNQTFTVRGERGYDHFSSCRSSASSDNGETKSPVFRKTVWLPNISPVEDAQSNVFNDTDTVHNLEFHQVGTPHPYAFISLGANNNNNNNSSNNIDQPCSSNSNNSRSNGENQDYA